MTQLINLLLLINDCLNTARPFMLTTEIVDIFAFSPNLKINLLLMFHYCLSDIGRFLSATQTRNVIHALDPRDSGL